jgi:hypothetical protein
MFLHIHGIPQLEMRYRIGKPSLSERFPMTNINIPRSQHIPHGHLIGTGIRCGNDTHEVILWNAEETFGFGDGKGETFFAEFGTVGASKDGGGQVG